MKINWGTAIVLAFIGFIAFILFFVIKMSTNDMYQHDLVTEDYYKKELDFQDEIDAQKNSASLNTAISVTKTNEGLVIEFPTDIHPKKVTGTVILYRPSNKRLDFQIPISLTDHQILVPNDQLIEGRWNITIDWQHEGTPYLFKKSITY